MGNVISNQHFGILEALFNVWAALEREKVDGERQSGEEDGMKRYRAVI